MKEASITIRISEQLKGNLQKMAEAQGKTLTDLIMAALEKEGETEFEKVNRRFKEAGKTGGRIQFE